MFNLKKTKRVLSIFLVLTMIASLFAIGTINSDAATKPARPTLSIVNGGSASGLYIKWNSVANAKQYRLAYRQKGAKSYNYLIFGSGTQHTTISGLKSGVAYEAQVQGIGTNNVNGPWSYNKSMTFIAVPKLTIKQAGSNTAPYQNLSWNKITGANGYQVVKRGIPVNQFFVECKNNGTTKAKQKDIVNRYKKQNSNWKTILNKNVTAFNDQEKAYGRFYYQIRAYYKTENNGTAYSAWSTVKETTLHPKVEIAKDSYYVVDNLGQYNYTLYLKGTQETPFVVLTMSSSTTVSTKNTVVAQFAKTSGWLNVVELGGKENDYTYKTTRIKVNSFKDNGNVATLKFTSPRRLSTMYAQWGVDLARTDRSTGIYKILNTWQAQDLNKLGFVGPVGPTRVITERR